MVKLFNTNKEELKRYAETLTKKQKDLARSHLNTYSKIRKMVISNEREK